MYARSVGSSRQRTGRAVHITAPRREAPVPPPDYGGTAIPPVRENRPPQPQEPFETLFRDGSREEMEPLGPPPFVPDRQEMPETGEEVRYPLYEERQERTEEPAPMSPWITRRRDNERRPGLLGGLLPVSLEMDDMLLAALIILLLANGSDEETILILAFLLLAK